MRNIIIGIISSIAELIIGTIFIVDAIYSKDTEIMRISSVIQGCICTMIGLFCLGLQIYCLPSYLRGDVRR